MSKLRTLHFLLAGFAVAITGYAEAEIVRLSGGAISVQVESPGGNLMAIGNQLVADTKNLRDTPFRLITDAGEISPLNCPLSLAARDTSGVTFSCRSAAFEVILRYAIHPEANALRKHLSITNRGAMPVRLFRISMFDWTIPREWPKGYGTSYYPPGINDIHFHKSGIWYNHSINLFLRDEKGGLFAGVENPFFDARYRWNRKTYPSRVEIFYEPNWIVQPGETFESDPGFVGVYRQEGVFRVPPPSVFTGGGLLPLEILDWGEVWAMQKYMHTVMIPPRSLARDDFIATEYWGLADPGRLARIWSTQQNGGALDNEERAMLDHFGGGPFRFADNEVWFRLTPDTLAFYKTAVDDAADLGHFRTIVVPNLMAGHKGWFESDEQKPHAAELKAMEGDWYGKTAFPLWSELARYARSKGLWMFNFEIAGGVTNPERPEWRYVTADGKSVSQYCYANRDFARWHAGQVSLALSRHPIGHWQWDEGWMDSLAYAVAGYIGDDAYCYAQNHRHPPGNVRYHQFRNVMDTLAFLRQQHPHVRLVMISGLIPGMPWIMKHLNNDSHTGLGSWESRNIYFLPPAKSRREGSIAWLANGASSGAGASHGDWYTMLEYADRRAEWKRRWDRWNRWAIDNLDFLNAGRDLFAGPRLPGSLRGRAHFLGGRGYLFVHNPAASTRAAEIPLCRLLGIEEGTRFRLRQLYPAGQDYGVWKHGSRLQLPLAPGATVLLDVSATEEAENPRPPAISASLEVDKAFFTLEEVERLLNADDFWPARPLPGKPPFPVF